MNLICQPPEQQFVRIKIFLNIGYLENLVMVFDTRSNLTVKDGSNFLIIGHHYKLEHHDLGSHTYKYTMTFFLHQGGVVMSSQVKHTHSHQDTPLSPYT